MTTRYQQLYYIVWVLEYIMNITSYNGSLITSIRATYRVHISGVARILVRVKNFWGSASWGVWEAPENIRKFSKYFLRKLLKCIILPYFSKGFNKPCVNFSRLWTKNTNRWETLRKLWNFWWKFNRKFEFLAIFGMFVTENRAFGNNIIFLQQFFPFRRDFPPFHPGYATAYYLPVCSLKNNISI